MRRRFAAIAFVAAAIALSVSLLLISLPAPGAIPDPLKHDGDRWAVVRDDKGDRIAVEPTSDEVWAQLVQMREDGSELWVGGIVERYDSSWGFRFQPATINVAEVTAEGAQSTIRFISDDVDYWLGGWAYVFGGVLEVHAAE